MRQKESITHITFNTTPLCYLPDGRLLCYRNGMLIVMHEEKEKQGITIPISTKERLMGRFRLPTRLFRLGFRAAIALEGNGVLLSQGNMLNEVDLRGAVMSKGWYCGEGVRPLIFTSVKNIDGFEDGIYFGGYLGNSKKNPVNVYKRKGVDDWEVVYTFPQDSINHVHNIVADPYRNCLWVFTGDFGEAAAIWKVTDGFKEVERVACNDQKYRGCVAYALPEGLLYATDAPFADNYIQLLDVETLEVKQLFPLHGSCIYGCLWKNQYVFSSTVEGDGRNTSRWEFYFGRKRGAGIKDDYIHLYCGNVKEGFREIYKEKKDCLPLYTFQFGVFKFPYGVNNTDTLYFQPVATKKNDLSLMAIKYNGVL